MIEHNPMIELFKREILQNLDFNAQTVSVETSSRSLGNDFNLYIIHVIFYGVMEEAWFEYCLRTDTLMHQEEDTYRAAAVDVSMRINDGCRDEYIRKRIPELSAIQRSNGHSAYKNKVVEVR